jgi:DNA-binding GntR family transcriptional regulator
MSNMYSEKRSVLSLSSMKISRSRLQDDVYERLRELILDGEIAAGQTVMVQALSEMFGVSAMPVREALLRLMAMQAFTIVSGRSIGILPLTEARLTDLDRIRRVFEGATAEWAVDNVSDAAIDSLEKIVRDMESAAGDRDVKRWLKLDREFHFTIYRLSGSEAACGVIEGFWLQITPYFHEMYRPDFLENANHRIILAALKARDKNGVGQGIREGIDSAHRRLVDGMAI